MKIAILGFGREGKAIYKYIKRDKSEIWILDKNPNISLPKNVKSSLGENYLDNLDDFDIIFRSPGIPYPLVAQRIKNKSKISSMTKLFFNEIQTLKKPEIIGVTGTKGKGTTCTLIYQMLKNSGFKTVLGGNMGKPMIDYLSQSKKADFIVLELSSFQLQDMTMSPDIAVVVDMFPDHLDAHQNLKEYYDAKSNIGKYQKKSDVIFYYGNNPISVKVASKSPAIKKPVLPKNNNLKKNFEMASAVARYCKCPQVTIDKTIKNFKGLEHRLEFVKSMNGINFYNDSAGTNPIATIAAIKSFDEPIILIVGGKDKGFNYGSLGTAIKNSTVKNVVLFGENKNKILKEIDSKKISCKIAKNLEEAVNIAFNEAKKIKKSFKSVIVLFSPASASFDMFNNYAERGEKFKGAVDRI